jgi:hypothetical protein
VYLFYDKCRKSFYDSKKLDAFIIAQATRYTSPTYSRSDVHKKNKSWGDFIKTLDYESLKSKVTKKTIGTYRSMFSRFGIMIKGPGGK